MWPTLISFGSFSISTISIILLLGFFLTGLAFWRRGKEEHYSEIQLFDGFLLSFLVGLVGARIGFILLNWSRFGLNIGKWLDFIGNRGLQDIVFIIISSIFLKIFSTRKKWDVHEVLDFWSITLTVWLLFGSIGEFFAGVGRGKFTESFIGITFPGAIQKTHPVQVYSIIFFFILYIYLNWAESRYRTFEWYRLGKKAAQTGFLMSNFWIFFSLFSLLMLFFRLPEFIIAGKALDGWIYLGILFYGVRMLLGRSDKPFLPASFREKLRNRSRKKREE